MFSRSCTITCTQDDAKLRRSKRNESIEGKHNAFRCWRATNKRIFKILNAWPLQFGQPRVINYGIIEIIETLQIWKKKISVPPCTPGNLSRLWSVPPYNLATVDVRAFSSKQAAVWDSLCVFLSLGDPSSHFKSQMKTSPFLLLSLYILMSLFRCSDLTLHCNVPKQNLH